MSTTTPNKPVWNYCIKCRRNNKHTRLFTESVSSEEDYDYHSATLYSVVKCDGCEKVSFRIEYHDYEAQYQDENGEVQYEITIRTYPPSLYYHESLNRAYYLPSKIRTVYEEAIRSFQAQSFLLAGAGFRALIEAICIEKNIKGRDLGKKIDELLKNRLITEKEAERLHSIRFLGNDSIHDMEVPSSQKLYIVLNIVEHLLNNLYLLDREAKNVLDTIIKNFSNFEELLFASIQKLNDGEEKNLKEILGKHVRRTGTLLGTFEAELIAKLKSGEIKYLTIGAIKPYKGSSTQHFVINKPKS